VRDQDQIAGTGALPTIHPGQGVYTIPAAPGYRFQRRDHCFVVVAELEQRYAPIESQGTFCARPSPGGGWDSPEALTPSLGGLRVLRRVGGAGLLVLPMDRGPSPASGYDGRLVVPAHAIALLLLDFVLLYSTQ
jgi:hypothetical protein